MRVEKDQVLLRSRRISYWQADARLPVEGAEVEEVLRGDGERRWPDELPDIIHEAVISSKETNSTFRLSEGGHSRSSSLASQSSSNDMTFSTSPPQDSSTSIPDAHLRAYSQKYGPDLTANFLEIKHHGANAFFTKRNDSTDDHYSLCTCATGYIWVRASLHSEATIPEIWSEITIQIGTFALRTLALSITSIPCQYKITYADDIHDGKLAILCATVMAKYLKLRMCGVQCEEAAEMAIRKSRKELAAFRVVDPGKFGDLKGLLLRICESAPMPPVSEVSEISRQMVLGRWRPWVEEGVRERPTWKRKVAKFMLRRKSDAVEMMGEVVGRSN